MGRFEIVSTLGTGGQGRVYLARDAEREGMVAIKRVRDASGASLLRLKAEFRAVAELRHPGLVRLFELGHDDDGLYFTMEPIDGVQLDHHLDAGVAPPTSTTAGLDRITRDDLVTQPDPESVGSGVVDLGKVLHRLAPIVPAILDGLAALHGHGLIHRDLKPSNVMVARDGAVKLLDFGILAELGGRGELIGTPTYMAPEQIEGAIVTPATDLYALGVLLYRVLSGRSPFKGSRSEVLRCHREVIPRSLELVAPAVPAPLVLACARLLDKRPDRRPDMAWIDHHVLRPLGWPRLGAAALVAGRGDALLVGRDALQARLIGALGDAQRGGAAALVLAGPTGIGKTRLVEWLAGEARGRGVVTLRGRARAYERVPFNAIDGAIDGLARLWIETGPEEVDDRVAGWLRTASSAFPVFWRCGEARPRREARVDAFTALAALLGDAARAGGALVVLDDLQWADDDSLTLLDSLIDATAPGVLIVGTVRDEPEHAGAMARLAAVPGVEVIAVTPLGERELAQVIAHAARRRGVTVETTDVTALVAQCEGRAMIAEVIGRGLAVRADPERGALDALLNALPVPAHAILAALEVADQTVPLELLARVVGEAAGAVEDQLVQLGADGLVHRQLRGGRVLVDLYHDVVRAGVRARQTEATRRAGHDAYVTHLAADDTVAPERLVRHLVGAGRVVEAGVRALDAAERASARFAHGLAAEMYQVALTAATEPAAQVDVLRRLATCLDAAACYREAAVRWRELGALVAPEERAEAAVHEASSLLGAADVVEGYARLAEASRQLGATPLRSRGLGALRDGLRFLRGPRLPRHAGAQRPLDDATRRQVARDIHLAALSTYFDPLTGVRYMLRARDACAALGALEDVAGCEYQLAFMAYFSSDRRGPVRAAARWRAAGDARTSALTAPGVTTRASPIILDGVALMRDGQFERAGRTLDEALTLLEAGGIYGSLEHVYILVLRCAIALIRQRAGDLAIQHRRLVAAFAEGGGSTVRAQVELLAAGLAFLRGDLDETRRIVRGFAASWPTEPPTAQGTLGELMAANSEIGAMEPAALRRRVRRAIASDRPFRLLRSMDAALYWSAFALVEARALLAGDPDASRRVVDRYAARALAAPPFGGGRALRARAYVAPRAEQTLALLVEAEREAERWGQLADLAVARHQRGKRLGGDEGATLIASARQLLEDAGAPGHWLGEDEVT